jgi:dolichol kinase
MESTLSELVKKTEGLQPWRRLFHAANGVVLVLVFQAGVIGDRALLAALGTLLAVLLLLDLIRLSIPEVNRLFFIGFTLLASPRETARPASSTWYLLGVLLTLILFPRDAAMGGILALAIADPAATLVGRQWGKKVFGKGTVEGSLVFAAVAFGALAIWAPWPQALGGAVLSAVVEALPWSVDDNLTIPLAAAGALLLLS